MNNYKKILVSLFLGSMIFMSGFNPNLWSTGDDDPDTGPYYVTYDNIFPFTTAGKTWGYTDEDGNDFMISVIDTISDEDDLYYKVEFKEVKLNMIQDDWFIRDAEGIKYSDRLMGDFDLFLPKRFIRGGGSFQCNSQNINYEIISSLTLGTTTYTDVLKLSYTKAVLHGFDEIFFADNIGIIQMIDYDGRWPVYYTLD